MQVKEVQRGVAFGQVFDRDFLHRLLQLRVEIVNPQLVKVAQHDVGRTMRHEVEPVVKRLLIVLGKFLAARFHFHEHAPRPDEIRILGFLARKAHAIFKSGTGGQRLSVVTEDIEQLDEEQLCLALFVALELGGEIGEFLKAAFL